MSNYWAENAIEHSDKVNAAARAGRQQGRDIGPPAPPVNPERKARAKEDFAYFCKTYGPEVFPLDWSPDHLKAIAKIEAAVLKGKLFALAMPRGSGKTTLCEWAALWALLYGHHRFCVFIGASEDNAKNSLDTIKGEIEENDLLHEDFQEATHPIRALEGSLKRAELQHISGRLTRIGWKTNEATLPTVEGSDCSGGLIRVRGIEGSIRGLKVRMPSGATARPSLVIIDDPQTDESAKSKSQCEYRERILKGAVLNLAGPSQKIAGIMPCTVIQNGDLAERILDRKENPEWQGERLKLVYQWPENEDLWSQYLEIRREEFENDGDGSLATEFYLNNREAMDVGATVAWEQRYNHDELSAIQNAYNLRARDEAAFYAEYQNEPLSMDEDKDRRVDPKAIARKQSSLLRGEIPVDVEHLTCFIDVQKAVLYWSIIGWETNGTGYVIDYNTWPRQKKRYFTSRTLRPTIQQKIPEISLEAQIYKALEHLDKELSLLKFHRDDGVELLLGKRLVDSAWGETQDTIFHFCRMHPAYMPSRGQGIGATGQPMNLTKKKPGELKGDNWKVPAVAGTGAAVRHVTYDTNFWKSYLLNRFETPQGARGCLSLFKADPVQHRLISDHMAAEYPTIVEAKGRTVEEWKLKPEKPDNHWFDCLVGCCVGGSMLGVSLGDKPQKKRRRITRL